MSHDSDTPEDRDLLGDMAPASFHPDDAWWRRLLDRLTPEQRSALAAGGNIYWNDEDGQEKTPLVLPAWVVDELDPPDEIA